MENILIRACTPNDIEEVYQLDTQWNREDIAYEFIPISREEFIAQLERFPTYFLVAESDGYLVGYINGTVKLNQDIPVLPKQETYLEIENIYVKPDFRNQQIGGKLIEKLLEIAGQNGIQRFSVGTVSKDMAKTLNFYQSYGFKVWHVQMFKE
jgi:ribosomal protein S18 acetylase RimI-like enzyme